MRIGSPNKLLLISSGIVFFSTLSALLINLLSNDEDFKKWFLGHRIGMFQLVIGVILSGGVLLILTYLQLRDDGNIERTGDENSNNQNIELDIKKLVDSLRDRYQSRYEQKLDGRFEITLEVTEDWNDLDPQIFLEKYREDFRISEAFQYISTVFERKKRLLISGNPGVGKTVLLLKFALNLLENNKVSKNETFPVIFNLVSWSEEYEKFDDWLIAMLVSGNGLSKDFAALLLHRGRIVFLLDGLDELARNEVEEIASFKRARCVESLNLFLMRGRKAIICCRPKELVQMHRITGQEAPVEAKVILLDLTEKQIETALLQASDEDINKTSAENLLEILDTEKSRIFMEVLCTPFYFTTALEVFDQQILSEKKFAEVKDDLETFLVASFIQRKMDQTPNPHIFKREQSLVWLKWIATKLENKSQIAFELSDLQPDHLTKRWLYRTVSGLISFLFPFLFLSLGGNLRNALVAGLFISIPTFVFGGSDIRTKDIPSWHFSHLLKWRKWVKYLFGALCYACFTLMGGLIVDGTVNALPGFWGGGFFGLVFGIANDVRESARFVRLKNPYQRLGSGAFFEILQMCILAVSTGMIFFLYLPMFQQFNANTYLPMILISLWLAVVGGLLGLMLSPIFRHFILRILLTLEGAMPLKYATFLDYASELRILEKDGGHWRFRHQNLQEYFANLETK